MKNQLSLEEKFAAAWLAKREQAQKQGIRLRPMAAEDALKQAHRALSGNRASDGFVALAEKGRLDLSLEALAVDKGFTSLFTDAEADMALIRLLDAGYRF